LTSDDTAADSNLMIHAIGNTIDYNDLGVQYAMHNERLKGSEVAVTVTSPPSGTNSDTLFSKFARVAASSCGGAWRYMFFVGVDSDGFLIWLHGH
jgi:hypothetical protein